MTTIYIIIKILTFPGALVRGFWEHLVCRIFKIPVEDNRLIRKDELSSHIEHELFPTARGAFCICFIPAFLNGLFALLLAIPSTSWLFLYDMTGTVPRIICAIAFWFALSLYVNSYPLVEDAMNMRQKIYQNRRKPQTQTATEEITDADADAESKNNTADEADTKVEAKSDTEKKSETDESENPEKTEKSKEKPKKEGSTILQRIVYAPAFLGLYIGAFAEKYSITFVLAIAGLIGLILQ